MSKEPTSPAQGDESQPHASTSGSNQQSQQTGKDGTASTSNKPEQQSSGSDATAAGQNGPAATAAEEKNETPEALRQELDALRRELAAQLQKKQNLDRQLVSHESAIYAFETSYLSVDLSGGPTNATFGNIVKGYDSYLKSGAAAAEAVRKKQSSSSTRGHGGLGPGYATGVVGPGGTLLEPVQDSDRLFSRSSGTYLDSLQLRERDQAHLMGMMGGSSGNTGNNTASEVEELDDGDLNDGNDSTAGPSTAGNTPLSGNAPASASSNKAQDASGQRDPKRQKKNK